MRKLAILTLALAILTGIAAAPGPAQRDDPCAGVEETRDGAVVVPSADHRTIQSAVCAVPDRGTILVRTGVYHERITIRGKQVRLVGDGRPNAPDEWPELHAVTPSALVPARDAHGTVTVEDGGGVSIRNFRFVGGDAQIMVTGEAQSLDVKHAVFEGAWRGVLDTSSVASVQVHHAHFRGQQHNGISFSPGLLECKIHFDVAHATFVGQVNTAVLIKNCGGGAIDEGEAFLVGLILHDLDVEGTGNAGLVVENSGILHFNDVHISNATTFGILLFGSDLLLTDSSIEDTGPHPVEAFGDGISLWPLGGPPSGRRSGLVAINVEITDSFRAGISNHGSFAFLANVTIVAGASFALAGGQFPTDGFDFEYDGAGGNICTDDPEGDCIAQPISLVALPPVSDE